MAELRVCVNEQTYTLSCDDGEEDRVRALAAYLDEHVQRMATQVGRSAESRLLMLAALNICDELFDAREKLAATSRKTETQTSSDAA